jgi:hypothetical protein
MSKISRRDLQRRLEQLVALGAELDKPMPRLPAGFEFLGSGGSCEVCGNTRLASMSGHGYCLVCGIPADDIPLVPVIASPTVFHRIQSAWERRFEPSERRGASLLKGWGRASRKARRPAHRPSLLTDGDLAKLRRMVKDQPRLRTLERRDALERLAAQCPKWSKMKGKKMPPHPLTIQRALKRLGLLELLKPAR